MSDDLGERVKVGGRIRSLEVPAVLPGGFLLL